ncbi:hypothetical protein C8J42_101944 [Sphingomonas sp. PP-CE-1A-559]|uniref:hypothetical protein n=1 Tax=Sphingomonas sp. PP-CE-1A-559 TaxID=2135657 RepID=UPI0010550B31|nr:hypothetical protein [Sphingomonas sp. PP-CE-1A-559]TCP94478.1 hypothetical protein C8J42_101944 [Sphingomonas sp. PP-CE-1A-559]
MRVVTDAGVVIDLGTVETAPTIGIVDYSRRVTDDYGVTTVVERGFARRMSVRLAVPFDDVDELQRRLTDLRATPAKWIADDQFAALSFRGFYKEFEIDHAVPPLSYCTLTVEGLAATEQLVDGGTDPAPIGQASTLQLIQPAAITDVTIAASTIAETDRAEWSAGVSYALGAQVIKAATHRIYESAVAANTGDDPAAASGKWIDIGPTNRWAMFDQALGTTSSAADSITVTLNAAARAIALLDVVAATVRVRATGYDRTIAASAGTITFLDLPAGTNQVTVTIAGAGTVSVGTLLLGRLVALGITEASPTSGITDYSRKEVDDFGEVTIVERASAKRMTAKALIRTDALDLVANRLAAVRARPSLWIGQAGIDSLTIYGFFKDFSIEAGEGVSKLSLSIEGFSTAAKVEPLGVDWQNVKDTNPAKPKPADGATNSADPASPLGPDDTVADVLEFLAEARRNATEGLEQIAATKKELDAARLDLDRALAQARQTVQAAFSGQLLEQRRKARVDFLTHLDGVRVGVVVQQETEQRIEGELATATTFALLGAKNSTGTAFILDSSTVLVTPELSLSEKFETIEAQFEGVNGDAEAAITRLDKAIANEKEARVEAIEGIETTYDGLLAHTNATIRDLDIAVSDGDRALAESIEDLGTKFEGDLADATADITDVKKAVSDETEARATAIRDLSTDFTTAIGDKVGAAVTTLEEAISDETEARAKAITDLGADFTDALGDTVGAAVTDFKEAIADETEARGVQYGLVTARLDKVGGGTASVEQLFSAQADALGNLSARASLAVTAGGVWSGITVTAADGSQGAISDITMSAMTINVSTAKLIFNNGSVMKVLGTGFGVGNEFIDWFGPSMPIALCSRANGKVWQTVSGDAYFGGALSAGTLTNGGQSSSVAPDVIADTGGFGSDGGKITVVISWAYVWEWRVNYGGSTAGAQQFDNAVAAYGATSSDGGYTWSGTRVETGSPTLTLAREIGGAARIDVAMAAISPGAGTVYGERPIPAGQEGGYLVFSATWSTSLTYTDPDRIVADRRFIATLARGFTTGNGTGSVSQRVTIITTEE